MNSNIKNKFDIHSDPVRTAQKAAQIIAEATQLGESHIALSGGSTPKILFRTLNTPVWRDKVKWENLHFWWGDERMVPQESEESNYGEALRLLSEAPLVMDNMHTPATDLSPEKCAEAYEAELRTYLDIQNDHPSFTITFLGMGEDGHTASLFPGFEENADQPTCISATHPVSGQVRISLSEKAILNSERIYFLTTGRSKAPVISKILEQTVESKTWPASWIHHKHNNLIWLIDEDASPFKD